MSKFKKIIERKTVLRFLYGGSSIILILLLIGIPKLVEDSATLDNFILAKDILQKVLIFTLAASIWISAKLYQRNLEQIKRIRQLKADHGELEADFLDAIKHIGSVNVRLEAIKSAVASVGSYPKNKQDFKKTLEFFAQKILTIANVDWVTVRLVDMEHHRTLREHSETRGGQTLLRPEVNNQDLLDKQKNLTVFSSDQSDLVFKTYCIMPKAKLDNEEDVLIKAILNQLEMIFVIFTSKYYKENYLKK